MDWDPRQYARYADARARPFFDLLARVDAKNPRRVVDLGCGPGALTAALAQRWPRAQIEGLDSSLEMIEQALPLTSERLSFRAADIAEWSMPEGVAVVISNATLQWVPGHLTLLRNWAHDLPSGGWLAFGVPGNFDSPSHVLMRDVAESGRWAGQLAGVLRHGDAVATPARYAEILLDAGLEVDVWDTTYLHRLDGPDPVLEWVRGTGLRPVLAALSAADGAAFTEQYAQALRIAYPRSEHGTIFAFRRIFAVAHRH